jgi:hypothetical protein
VLKSIHARFFATMCHVWYMCHVMTTIGLLGSDICGLCEVSSSHGGEHEAQNLLGCTAMSVDIQLRTRQYIPEDSELHLWTYWWIVTFRRVRLQCSEMHCVYRIEWDMPGITRGLYLRYYKYTTCDERENTRNLVTSVPRPRL